MEPLRLGYHNNNVNFIFQIVPNEFVRLKTLTGTQGYITVQLKKALNRPIVNRFPT